MVAFIRSDLDFILQQILMAEENAAGTPMIELLPNVQVPWGLRTVDGSFNNLVLNAALGIDQTQFGAADTIFPRLTDAGVPDCGRQCPAGFFGPGDPGGTTPTSIPADQRFGVRRRPAYHLQPDRRPDRQQPGGGGGRGREPRRRHRHQPRPGWHVRHRRRHAGQFHSEHQAGLRPDRAVQCLDDVLRPVLRPWPRSRDQGQRRRDSVHSVAAG